MKLIRDAISAIKIVQLRNDIESLKETLSTIESGFDDMVEVMDVDVEATSKIIKRLLEMEKQILILQRKVERLERGRR